MAPDVDYTLTEEEFNRYEILLAEQGVTVRPMRRESEEMLDSGATTLRVYGALRQDTHEFPYTITKTSKGKHMLNVEPYRDGRGAAEGILAAVERAFPQPERGLFHRPQPERRFEPGTFTQNCGCLFIILFFVAVCVFAIIGVASMFR